jgi:hypothetical protein
MHVPFVAAPFATLQAWQSLVELPPHALLQHTPSTQKPLMQSVAATHAVPFALNAKSSALESLEKGGDWPPTASTLPSLSNVVVKASRFVMSGPVALQVPDTGS